LKCVEEGILVNVLQQSSGSTNENVGKCFPFIEKEPLKNVIVAMRSVISLFLGLGPDYYFQGVDSSKLGER
jgi:hypothetical protein